MPVRSKVALVIDALPAMGGAEKVLLQSLALFPDAPVYTLVYNPEPFARTPLARHQVITSSIDKLPGARAHYRKYLPWMPRAIEEFELGDYEWVLSFSYAVAHGVRLLPGQRHLSYTFTPLRYAWNGVGLDGSERMKARLWRTLFGPFRRWDQSAAARVDRLAAVSCWIAGQIQAAYRRSAVVIYPPVKIERFSPQPARGEQYITVSRLVPHKRVDLIVEAFNRLGLPLWVVGEGPEREKLEHRSNANIRFLGYQPDGEIARLLGYARAFVCAAREDFGIAVVEAQAAGCPVIAYGAGGVLETVIEGETGLFFQDPSPESLAEAVRRFEACRGDYYPEAAAAQAARFNPGRFLRELADFVKA